MLPACDLKADAMCEKCVELDGKIEHYRVLASCITDQPILDGIKELIEQMQAQKGAIKVRRLCPCHGSMFGPDGQVLNAPATAGLESAT